jgi:hypothetical protein
VKGSDFASLISPRCNSHSELRRGSPIGMPTSSELRLKRPRAEGGLLAGLSRQVLPTQVTFDHEGGEDHFICVSGRNVCLTSHHENHQVLVTLAAVAASSSGLGQIEPPSRRHVPRIVYPHLVCMCMRNATCLLCTNLSTMVS